MELRKTIDDVREHIPFNLRGNFDKNSKCLTIEYGKPRGVTDVYDDSVQYCFDTNTIYLDDKFINSIDSIQLRDEVVSHFLIKGLLLMASTNYKRNRATSIGFSDIERYGVFKENYNISNVGLTSGYIELLACEIEGKDISYIKSHPLSYLILFSKQIEMIVGKDLMYELFFKNNNKQLEKVLSKLDCEMSISDLLENISNVLYAQSRDMDCSYEILDIQEKLIRLFLKSKNTNELFENYMVDLDMVKPKVKSKTL